MKKIIDRLRLKVLKYYFRTKSISLSIRTEKFKLFSILYLIISLFLISLSYKQNTFVLIDSMSGFFLTIGGMFGSILALCITIHFFYVQNFSNYNALIFINDINNSKRNYLILTTIGILTVFFFYLGGNLNSIIYMCPDKYLLPFSILSIALVLWLVIYFFYHTTKKLSPKGIIEDIESYFRRTLIILQKYQNIDNKYSKTLGIDNFKKNVREYGTNYNKVGRYKLEALCDNYLKLVSLNEYRLSQDLLICIERCFGYLIQSYGTILSSIELDYLTNTTQIDAELNRFCDKIEHIILLNINKNDLEGIIQSFRLYREITIKTFDIKYSNLQGENIKEKTIFSRLIIRWEHLFKKIIGSNHEEAFFQRKEGVKKITLKAIYNSNHDSLDNIYYMDGLLSKLNILHLRVENNHKEQIFGLYDIYSDIFLSTINKNTALNYSNIDIVNKRLLEFLGKNTINIDNFIQSLWKNISTNQNYFPKHLETDIKNAENFLFFIENITIILEKISVLDGLTYGNWVGLLIESLGLIYFNIKDSKSISKELLNNIELKILEMIDIVINKGHKNYPDNIFLEQKLYSQLCRLGIDSIIKEDIIIYNKSFDIFSRRIINILPGKLSYHLGILKYFCYWFFIDKTSNYDNYLNIFDSLFKKYLEKFKDEHKSYGKKDIITIINEIKGAFDESEMFGFDLNLSERLLIEYFKNKITIEQQEIIMKKVLIHCYPIYKLK